MMNNCELIGHM